MYRAGSRDIGPVGAIYQANVAGGELGKVMQEGKVTRVEVEGGLLQVTGHVWVISAVEEWKLESHDILGEGVTLGRKERRGEKGKGAKREGGCGTSSRSRNKN
jgi:hypothetical protein